MAALLCAAMLLLPGLAWILAPKAGGFVAPPPLHAAKIEQGQAAQPAPQLPKAARATPTTPAPAEPRAEGPVTGTVLDPDGKPVSGAFVGCDDRDKELSTTTDKEGHFKLPPQASGCKAVCHHPDFTPTERTEIVAGRDNVLRLRSAGAIEGVVVDEKGAPVPSFLLAIESFMGAGEAAETGPPGGQAKSFQDPKGAFLMEGLLPGKYVLTASAEGRPPAKSGTIEVDAGRTTHHVKIVLPKGAVLSGKVIDAETRKPIAGAVIALDAITQTSANAIKPAKTDETGSYVLEGAPPGPFSIRVAQERYRTKIVPGLLTRGSDHAPTGRGALASRRWRRGGQRARGHRRHPHPAAQGRDDLVDAPGRPRGVGGPPRRRSDRQDRRPRRAGAHHVRLRAAPARRRGLARERARGARGRGDDRGADHPQERGAQLSVREVAEVARSRPGLAPPRLTSASPSSRLLP
jgi:hypothetical protein